MIAQTAKKKVSDSSDQLNLNQPSAISAIGISAISAIAATTIAETDFSSFLIKAGFHMIVRGGRKGVRYCGFALFLVRFCGNFHFKLRYFGFPLRGGLRFV